eukprot:628719-Prymnesium_polylepis.1
MRVAEEARDEIRVRQHARVKLDPQRFGVPIARADRLVGGLRRVAARVPDPRVHNAAQRVVAQLRLPKSAERHDGKLRGLRRGGGAGNGRLAARAVGAPEWRSGSERLEQRRLRGRERERGDKMGCRSHIPKGLTLAS